MVNDRIILGDAARLRPREPERMPRLLDKIAREAFRPVWRHTLQRIEPRLAKLEQGGGDGMASHVPAFLNAVRSVRAFAHELGEQARRLSELEQRIDAELDVSSTRRVASELHTQVQRIDTIEEALEAARDSAAKMQLESSAQCTRLDSLQAQIGPRSKLTDGSDIVRALEAHSERFDDLEGRIDQAMNASVVSQMWDRIEFIRREILFEMSYRHGRAAMLAGTEPGSDVEPRIVALEKLAAEELRLNLGCGHIPLEGYVNVDMRDLPGVDVIAHVGSIPVEAGTIDEVYSAHLVEHFPQEMMRRQLLPYWRSLLKPGGRFRAVAPDGDAMIRAASAGSYDPEDFREVLFGAQDYNGDFHYNLLWPESFADLLREAGFDDVDVPVRGRRNGKCFEFEIVAARPI